MGLLEHPDLPTDEIQGDIVPGFRGKEDLDYARLYLDSSPVRHRRAWEQLAGFGDDSQTYYWRVLAAREIMRL